MSRGATATIATGAGFGAAVCLVGLIASFWQRTGTTPAAVYEYFKNLRSLTAGHWSLDLPIEFFAAAGFGAVFYTARSRRLGPNLQSVFAFALGVVSSAWFGLEVSDHGPQLLTATLGLAAAAAIVLAASTNPLSLRSAIKEAGIAGLSTIREPRARVIALVILFAVSLFAVGVVVLRDVVQPRGMAPEARNFERWFQSVSARAVSSADSRVRVVAFLEFSSLRSTVAYRTLRRMVTDSSALPAGSSLVSAELRSLTPPGSCRQPSKEIRCEVAASALFVFSKYPFGPASEEFTDWLFRADGFLSADVISEHLRGLGLESQWVAERPQFLERVATDQSESIALKVNSEPAVFVDGIPTPFFFLQTAIKLRHGSGKSMTSEIER